MNIPHPGLFFSSGRVVHLCRRGTSLSGGMARILIGKNIFSTDCQHSHRHENRGPLPSPPIFLPGNIFAPAQQRQHATPPQSPNPRRSPARSLGLLARFLLSGERDSPSFTQHLLPSSPGSETDTFPRNVGPVHANLVKDRWVKDVPGLETALMGGGLRQCWRITLKVTSDLRPPTSASGVVESRACER